LPKCHSFQRYIGIACYALLLIAMSKPRPTPPGLFGLLSFSWVNQPIFKARRKGRIDIDELYMPDEHRADHVHTAFDRKWTEAMAKRNADGKESSRPLLRVLLSMYGGLFFLGGLFKLMWSALVICGAYFFVKSLLLHVDPKEKGHPYTEGWSGVALALGFFGAATLWGTCPPPWTVDCG
jgi:hypothetical protein